MRVNEPGPYRFHGDGPSLIADMHAAARGSSGDPDGSARDRLRAFEKWSTHVAEQFAVGTTSTLSEIVPPGYSDVALLDNTDDRPLTAAVERAVIADASPFTVPIVATLDVTDPARAEGADPAASTFEVTAASVTPRFLFGTLELTRELVDSASPAGDVIALSVAAEDYRRKVEQAVYNELNAAADTLAVVTTPGTFVADLRHALAQYAETRKRRPRSVVVGGNLTEAAGEVDWTTDTPVDFLRVSVSAATAVFGTAPADAQAVVLGSGDVWMWESPLMRFQFEEKSGPGLVELSAGAHHATKVVRPAGVLKMTE